MQAENLESQDRTSRLGPQQDPRQGARPNAVDVRIPSAERTAWPSPGWTLPEPDAAPPLPAGALLIDGTVWPRPEAPEPAPRRRKPRQDPIGVASEADAWVADLVARWEAERDAAAAANGGQLPTDWRPSADPYAAGEGPPGISPCVSRNNWRQPSSRAAGAESGPPMPVPTQLDRFPSGTFLGAVERRTEEHRQELAEAHHVRAVAAARDLATLPVGELRKMVTRVRAKRKAKVPLALALKATAKWHRQRSMGQLRRFETIGHCGEGAVGVTCRSCGWEGPRLIGCDARRLCVSCRERKATPMRDAFMRSRASVLREATQRGYFRRARAGGRYTEKHVTFTLPDSAIPAGPGAVRARIAALFAAWRSFSKELAALWKIRRRCRHCGAASGRPCRDLELPGAPRRRQPHAGRHERAWWWRGFEWTPGDDGHGHPHFHVWYLCAFLPVPVLRWLWARALHRAGVLVFGDDAAAKPRRKGAPIPPVTPTGELRRLGPLPEDPETGEVLGVAADMPPRCHAGVPSPYVIVDAREIRIRKAKIEREIIKGGKALQLAPRTRLEVRTMGGDDLIAYVAGWVVEDAGADVDVAAEVYCALEARRQVQASAGFVGRGRVPCACPQCKAPENFRIAIVAWSSMELPAAREAWGLTPRAGPAPPAGVVSRNDSRDRGLQLRLVL